MADPIPANTNQNNNIPGNTSQVPAGLDAGSAQASQVQQQPIVQLASSTAVQPQETSQQQVPMQPQTQSPQVPSAGQPNQVVPGQVPQPQVPMTPLTPKPVAPAPGAKPETPVKKQKKGGGLSITTILFVVIFVLLIIVIALAGLSISLLTNGGVDVSITAPATQQTQEEDSSGTSEEVSQQQEETDTTIPEETSEVTAQETVSDIIAYLTFDVPEGGDASAITQKYTGTTEIAPDTLLVPVVIKSSEAGGNVLSEALNSLIDPEVIVIDNELIVQFSNPLASSGLSITFDIQTVSGVVEDVTNIDIITADDLTLFSSEMVSLFKAQLENTISIYVDAYEVSLNGDSEAYTSWGSIAE